MIFWWVYAMCVEAHNYRLQKSQTSKYQYVTNQAQLLALPVCTTATAEKQRLDDGTKADAALVHTPSTHARSQPDMQSHHTFLSTSQNSICINVIVILRRAVCCELSLVVAGCCAQHLAVSPRGWPYPYVALNKTKSNLLSAHAS